MAGLRTGAVVLIALAGACSPEPAPAPDTAPETAAAAVPARTSGPEATAPSPSPTVTADADTLAARGLGRLRIGEPVPAGSGWAERGAQISDACRTVSSPDYTGVYAIVEGGKVRRISAGERSQVTLAQGIGAGATEAEVRRAFPNFQESLHVYVEPPAKYLTAPEAERGEPALRFEIGADRRVSLIHAGTMPVLGYVEGCA